MLRHLLCSIFLFSALQSSATTWNEPWQDRILEEADYFVFGEVFQAGDSLGLLIKKEFGNKSLGDTIFIHHFWLLDFTSHSSGSHDHSLPFNVGDHGYFLLKHDTLNFYNTPTPTSGYALMDEDKNVYATYRHSYHQALVPQKEYEFTYEAIWNHYKKLPQDKAPIQAYIDKYVVMSPAGFESHEINTFFLQHTAVEMAYHLGIEIDLKDLKPFMASDNWHQRVSALRVLKYSTNIETPEFLYDFITNKKNERFDIVIAIWSFWEIADKKWKKKLYSKRKKLPEESTGFGGNLMDPRIGTHFPDPRHAVIYLYEHKK